MNTHVQQTMEIFDKEQKVLSDFIESTSKMLELQTSFAEQEDVPEVIKLRFDEIAESLRIQLYMSKQIYCASVDAVKAVKDGSYLNKHH